MACSALNPIHPQTVVPGAEHDSIYRENCHRIYSRAFWMTDNELAAEKLSASTFVRAFSRESKGADDPATQSAEQIDEAFIAEMREIEPVGALTLKCPSAESGQSIRGRMKRIHLERAVVQLPATEKLVFLMHDVEGYGHSRISRLLGIAAEESRLALHSARMYVRKLVDCMTLK
jgi:RNA polymerase sigma-70 factor, ECF subfamily